MMCTYKPKDWLFLVPFPDEASFLFYAPLHGLATKVTPAAKEQLLGIIDSASLGKSLENFAPIATKFVTDNDLLTLPGGISNKHRLVSGAQGITLSLTNDCNLRCIYCYAIAGVDTATLSEKCAKQAIRYSLHLASSLGRKSFVLTFHGGGESLTRKKLFRSCVEYALEQARILDIVLNINLVTNATLITDLFAAWMKSNNVENITVSLDGSEQVQNIQRPMIKGRGSFYAAIRGISNLKKNGVSFSIRATVTSKSVCEMPDFVRFLAANVFDPGTGLVHFEPLSLCGKAHDAKYLDVTPYDYVFYYREARRVGKELGVKVTCTLDTFKKDTLQFRGASYGTMFCVCPGGEISACSRITKPQDKGSELFFYGAFTDDSEAPRTDSQALARINAHGRLPKIPCGECFARWNCQGFCPISRYLGEDTFGESCAIVKQLLLQDIAETF
jgi:uncharacterized protein